MMCPFCGHMEDKVIDSRESKEGDTVRRRRQCIACEKRFTTYERIDEVPYMVLRNADKISYVCFASVYRDFQDEEAFFDELKALMRQKVS